LRGGIAGNKSVKDWQEILFYHFKKDCMESLT